MSQQLINLLLKGLIETLYMVITSTAISYAIGIPLGILLFVTDKEGILRMRCLNKTLGFLVNMFRSIPFIILLIWALPFTRMIVGTTIGSTATIVPLVIASIPFVARMVEASLKELNTGIIEAAQSMGCSPFQIIWKVLLPEAKPSLITGSAIAITTILGYSAMAGFIGGGGLGTIAINYGYYRYQNTVMFITVILLVIVVQIFQEIGMRLAKKSDKRIKK